MAKSKEGEEQVIGEEDVGEVEEVLKEEPPKPADAPFEMAPIVEAEKKNNPRQFVRLSANKTVVEIISEVQNIDDEWHPDVRKSFVEITDLTDPPKIGYVHRSGKTFKEPDLSVPPDLQRVVAFRTGGKVNGRNLPVSPDVWQRMTEVAQHISMFDEFPGGVKKLDWPSDPPTEFTEPAAFMDTYKALSGWRHKWNVHVDSGKGKAPDEQVS